MTNRTIPVVVLLVVALLNQICDAQIELPNIFSDHMVLQRDQENRLWGKAKPGEKIQVSFAGNDLAATADDSGAWQLSLPAMPAGGPHSISIKPETGESNPVTIDDVLVGEVWICSGQSNMEWSVQATQDPDLERLAARLPRIRMINFPNVGSQIPVWTHPDANWQVCSPETVGGFSAVGFHFGKQLHMTLDVPIGLVNNSWGGSACDSWIDQNLLNSDERFSGITARWRESEMKLKELAAKSDRTEDENKRLNQIQGQMKGNQRPGNLYNGILKSHLGYGIRGVIWYQGESNAGRAYQYRELFPTMIQSWRNEWGQGDFPFYWVQLADFRAEVDSPRESDWAELREAQTMTLDRLPKTGQAVIIDVGEGRDIHPRDKQTVGRRLARIALANDYGFDIAWQSPRFGKMEIADGKALLTFRNVNDGWRPFDVPQGIGFSIAGEDKVFRNANATILKDGRVEVSHPEVANPVAVRYAWADNPVCNMYDNAGLPLVPFRTDDWPGVTINNQ